MPRPRKDDGPGTRDPSGLTFRQRLFVFHYLGTADGNGSEAARMAGFAEPGAAASRLLKNVNIRAAIDAKLSQAAMSADEVLARLSEMATVDAADFITITKEEVRLDFDKARRRGKTHLIKAIKWTKAGVSFVLHDSQAALEKLGRHHGIFGERADEWREGADLLDDAKANLESKLDSHAARGESPDPPGVADP
jgi:hypothetical protein